MTRAHGADLAELLRGGARRAARALLGAHLVRGEGTQRCVGRIVETEAYLASRDPACHAANGPTARNASMFLEAGHAYVYRIYGVHHCFNVVTGPAGSGEAVLIRALEPLEGDALMARRRGTDAPRALCSGPGKLVQALGIEPADDGTRLDDGPIRLLPAPRARGERVARGPRVGISRATELELRFWLAGSPFVSRGR